MELRNCISISAITVGLLLVSLPSGQAAVSQEEMSKVLPDLLQTYRAWGLPLPPKQARLMLFDYGWTQDARGKDTPLSHLAFHLNPNSRTDQPLLLVGTLEYRPESEGTKFRPADPDKLDAKIIRAEWSKPV